MGESVAMTSGPGGLAGGPGVPSSPGSQADPPTPWGPLCPTFLILTIDPGLRPGEAGRQRDDWVCGDSVVPGA